MSDELRLTIQVIVSLMIIFGVLWWMWRIPGEPVTSSLAATTLSFASVWLGVASILVAGWLWWTSAPQFWAVTTVLVWAAALSTGLLALWTYRHTPLHRMPEEVLMQRLQARVGVTLALISITIWYVYMIVRFSTLNLAAPPGPSAWQGHESASPPVTAFACDHTYHWMS